MGLFDIFKKKKNPEMPAALAKVFALFFPGGVNEQKRLTDGLCAKLGGRYSTDYVGNNYVFVLSCLFMDEDKTLAAVIDKVKNRVNNRLTSSEIKIIYNYAIENNEKLSATLDILSLMDNLCDKGPDSDVMPEGYGRFGLDITNPIPIHGVPENEYYLRKLRRADGSKITWNRLGSCNAQNISHIIDKYEIKDEYGNVICHLHLCPYCKKTSSLAPDGFIFEGQTPTMKKIQGHIMPAKGVSYATSSSGEPELVFYREITKLFVNTPIGGESVGYFLNIRRPLVIDVSGQASVDIPPIPDSCDGIILKGYGIKKSTAYVVRDKKAQSMSMQLGPEDDEQDVIDAHLLIFSA